MGTKIWMLAYISCDGSKILESNPQRDREATTALVEKLFPSEKLKPLKDGDFYSVDPPNNELVAGCFAEGLSIIAAKEFALDKPSSLDARFLAAAAGSMVYLHAQHSVVDWFAYAVWIDGKLKRSLSLSPDDGVIEDIGPRLAFEEPYWAGQHPLFDPEEEATEKPDYPFVFHPLDLAEAALLELFGDLEPEKITLARFKRPRIRWKFW